jgi:hypothetical protein
VIAELPNPQSPPLATKTPAEAPRDFGTLGAGPQTGQFDRSEAEAKLHGLGLDPYPRTTVASCEAICGLDHGTQATNCLLNNDRLKACGSASTGLLEQNGTRARQDYVC